MKQANTQPSALPSPNPIQANTPRSRFPTSRRHPPSSHLAAGNGLSSPLSLITIEEKGREEKIRGREMERPGPRSATGIKGHGAPAAAGSKANPGPGDPVTTAAAAAPRTLADVGHLLGGGLLSTVRAGLEKNGEATRKSRLRKKAQPYIQKLDSSRIMLGHLEQELQCAR
ncbi:hypothetical protein ACQJBY_047581 [Aegilops geniculata]